MPGGTSGISDANGSVASMVTTGLTGLSRTAILMVSETALAPSSSIAFAVSVYSPAGTFFHSKTQTGQTEHRLGSNVAWPRLLSPAKNSTECTCEIGSACATRTMVAGAENVALLVGL